MRFLSFALCGALASLAGAQSPLVTPADPYLAAFAVINRVMSTIILNDCNFLKNIFRINYDSLRGQAAKDLANLKISLLSGGELKDFNLTSANESLAASPNFIKTQTTVIYIHGFIMGNIVSGVVPVTDALLKKGGSINVLVLDRKAELLVDFLKASTYVRYMGEMLASVLNDLVTAGVSEDNIYLVGHGLGGHLAGFAGKAFKALSGKTLGRITALDPSGPCFYRESAERRLDKSDAKFVQVIHTDGGVFGIIDKIGHADFYPNNGENQPFPVNNVPLTSHIRAWELFAESVRFPKTFVGLTCSDNTMFMMGGCSGNPTALMGYGASSPPAAGQYFLKTGPFLIYGLGEQGTWNFPVIGLAFDGIAWATHIAEVVPTLVQ